MRQSAVSALRRASAHWALILALLLYLFFALTFLQLPGLQYDEALFANAALGGTHGPFLEWRVDAAGVSIPLMLMGYLGALKAQLYAPIFALFGTSVLSVRLPVVLIGAATLLFTYRFARDVTGTASARLCVLLLALDPSFIFANKLDWGPVALGTALKMASLYVLWRWTVRGGRFLLGAGSLLLGLGLYDKIVFIWFIAAVVLAASVCYPSKIKELVRPANAAVAATFLLLGCAPLVAFNILYPLRTFEKQRLIQNPDPRLGSLAFRGELFQSTLDGRAIQDLVHQPGPGELAEVMSRTTAGRLDRYLGWPAHWLRLDRTWNLYGLLIGLAAIGVLRLRARLADSRKIAFLVLLLALLCLFILITAQATGPHHVLMIFPFTHILTAFGLWQIIRTGRALVGSSALRGRVVALIVAGPFLVSELAVGTAYLKSFAVLGGRGNWSDAIYGVAGFASRRTDRYFALMDWGFSSQLLILTQGRIDQKEVFGELDYLPTSAEKMAALVPYLMNPGNILLFHVPRYESRHTFDLFKAALRNYSIGARRIETFYQRDGLPLAVAYETVQPELTAHIDQGRAFYLREAEDWNALSGGGREQMRGASHGELLGFSWGQWASDFAAYRFKLRGPVNDGRLYLRYAFAGESAHSCRISLDRHDLGALRLQPTGGYGWSAADWRLSSIEVGVVAAGNHEIHIAPASDHQVLHLDYFYLSEGPLQLRTDFSPRPAERPESDIASVIGGYATLPDVRLELTPGEITAGKSTLAMHVIDFDARYIDVLYSIDGTLMPILYGWRLDDSGRATVFVDRNTPRGVYEYRAIRDSAEASPEGWVRVQGRVVVK